MVHTDGTELRERLTRMLPPGRQLDQAINAPSLKRALQARQRRPEFGMGAPDARLSDDLLRKFVTGVPLPAAESMIAFSIVYSQLRPALEIVGGDYKDADVPEPMWSDLLDGDVRRHIKQAIGAVGRIEGFPGNSGIIGTGFVAGKNLIMTNRHVAERLGGFDSAGSFVFNTDFSPTINFLRERTRMDAANASSYALTTEALVHPFFDLALFRTAELPAEIKPLTFATDAAPPDAKFAIIGYPGEDPAEDPAEQDSLTGGHYDVKRLQPGFIRERKSLTFAGRTLDCIGHDGSTLKGSSGSPLIRIDPGADGAKVIGVHFNGRMNDGTRTKWNWACPSDEIARDMRIAAAGVTFDNQIVGAAGPWDGWWNTTGWPSAFA